MQVMSDIQAPESAGANAVPAAVIEPVDEIDLRRLAETFAVTPEAARLAVARVGTGFRDLQRELGGRR